MQASPGRLAVVLATAAVGLELCVSANLLTWAGIPYVTDGGALPLKFHPGTDLLVAAAGAALAGGQLGWLRRLPCTLWVFFGAVGFCLACVLLLTGTSNMIVLLDTFLPAGLLAAVLDRARPADLRALRRVMQLLLAANAVLALAEMATQATLVPLYLNDAAYQPHTEDFRPTALFDHPLTGALMMMMALAIAPGRGRSTAAGLVRLAYQGLIWAGLIVFGGRMALGVCVLTAGLGQAWRGGRLVLARDPRAAATLVMAAAGLAGCAMLFAAALAAGMGDRLAGHLYWDDSAQVRLAQWQVLGEMDAPQLLFGTPREALLDLLNRLRLGPGVEVIENFWLLMFVSLGAIGFPAFLVALAALCRWCWQRTAPAGRALLLGALVVASSSNSLGRKSTVLVCLVAATRCAAAGGAPSYRFRAARLPLSLQVAAA